MTDKEIMDYVQTLSEDNNNKDVRDLYIYFMIMKILNCTYSRKNKKRKRKTQIEMLKYILYRIEIYLACKETTNNLTVNEMFEIKRLFEYNTNSTRN